MRLDEFPTVTAIVLAYNGGKDLIICVDSLIKSVYPNLQILVVDNASVDGSVEELRKKFPGVEIVVNQNNFGYAAGNNIGIMRSSDEFIVLINQDAMVSPDWLGHLIDAAKRHKNGAFFQPKILLSS
ncbi:MAG: glycosyl transferase, partial [Thaumarchaeota archaeon]|nr:glycosyl transferase [Nitrososphaerota archaeon]